MESMSFRTTIVIKFSYPTTQAQTSMVDSTSSLTTTNAKTSCAVCGSQLHMTKHCPVHP